MVDQGVRSLDLLVVGGGLSGCMAALEAAGRGLTVAIVEKRAYLGREITAYNHTFVTCDADDDAFRRCTEPFGQLFRLHGGDEIVAPEGMTRQHLMRVLEEADIPVLFEAEPVAVSIAGDEATGLLLACPAGLAWLPGRAILDASERTNVLRLLAGEPYLEPGPAVVHGVLEMTAPSALDPPPASDADLTAVEEALDLSRGSLRLHPSLRNDTVVVECAFHAEVSDERYTARSLIETEGRRRSVALAAALREHVPGCEQASLSHLAYERHIAPEGDPRPAPGSGPALVAALPALPWGFSLADVAVLGESVEATVGALELRAGEASLQSGHLLGPGLRTPMAALPLAPYDDDGLNVPLFTTSWAEGLTPGAVFSCDVCVAGLGSGGGMAMVAAAERGCRVAALEVNRELGGTHTAGRVWGFYDGYRGGANESVEREAKRLMAAAISKPAGGGFGHAEYLLSKASARGVRLFTGSRVCGVRLEHGTVTQLLAANEDGLFAIEARVTVDTTGDADVAALAGAGYRVGDDRDGMLQSYSMWGTEVYPCPSFLSQRYLTDPGLYHPDLYSERLRAIAVAHRHNSPNHISPMLAARESRRIEGEQALSLRDILDLRVYPDAVAVASTRADSHAFTSSDLSKFFGGIGAGGQTRVRIPYGCFIPKGLEGLLVAAKALSGERDATSFCRMNADIINAGHAIGVAAAMAAAAGVGVRAIDLAALQSELKQLGVLPDWAFDQEEPEDSVADCKSLGRLLRRPAERVRPELERRYAALVGAPGDGGPFLSEKAALCMALAWHGSPLGADHLAHLLERAIDEGRHRTPPHVKAFRTSVLQAHRQDDFSLVNRLLVASGRSVGAEVLPPLIRLVEESPGLGESLPHAMPYDGNRGDIVAEPFYGRLKRLAYAVEMKADPALAPAMDRLLRLEGIAGHDVPLHARISPRYMLAHLEICLARAACRCGCRSGAAILIRYLNDTHVFFRRHARQELSLIAGADQGSVQAWERWLDNGAAWDAAPLRAT